MHELLITLLFGILLAPVVGMCIMMVFIYLYGTFTKPPTIEEIQEYQRRKRHGK